MASSTNDGVPGVIRRQRMLDVIGVAGFARVSDLSDEFQVSEVTVRSDLDLLDETRAIRRVHGGAVLREPHSVRERSFEESLVSSAEEKELIAHLAAEFVQPGSSILLDVGTTASAVARALVARPDLEGVTVITSGLTIALELERAIPRIQVIVTGGTLRPLQHSLVAPMASEVLAGLHADIAFIGCNGVHPGGGVTNVNLAEAEVKRMMVARSDRTVVIADGTKLGRIHLGRIARLEDVDSLITDQSASRSSVEEVREAGVAVLIAE